ncbi:MAG: 6-carboxytetrahydropterin synthase QueD [bacterium]
MYEVFKETSFSGAHHLRNYRGKCEEIHGHNWRVRVYVRAEELDKAGMVVDFKALKGAMEEVADLLDHKDVNAVAPFDEINPSAENMARFFFERVGGKVDGGRAAVSRVMVWETEGSCAIYSGD